MVTSYRTQFMQKPDAGFRLGDIRAIFDAITSDNAASAAYGIAAAGTTQATATALTSVYNQVDTVSASTGVNLPSSTGQRTAPFLICWVINNGASTLTVYAAQGNSTDTINGTAGSTGVSMPTGTNMIFVSAKPGVWEVFGGLSASAFGAITATSIVDSGALSVGDNITETAVGKGFIQKASSTGTGRAGTFTAVGASNVTVTNTTIATSDFIGISLNTNLGTVGALPTVQTIQVGTSFVVKGTASDSSTYNYTIIGASL